MTRMTVGQAMELAVAQQRAGLLDQAEAIYRQVLAVEPDNADALHLLGVVNLQANKPQAALEFIERAVAMDSTIADFQCSLGQALSSLGRTSEAIAALRRALELQPEFPEALNNLGIALQNSGDVEGAIGEFRKAISMRPEFAEARNNLGNALRISGQPDEAMTELRRASELKPDYGDALNNLGVALRDAGKIDEAMVSYRRAIVLRPDWPAPHHNLALALLLRGDLQKGFSEYEWRLRVPQLSGSHRPVSGELWDGRSLEGKMLFIHAEQGLGDTIQFVRYLPLVAERAGRIILQCQPELKRLFQNLPGVGQLIVESDPIPVFDVHCPLLSLPRIFKTTLETIPADVSYLRPDEELSSRWRERISGTQSRVKIGLAWAGRSEHYDDRNRSMSLGLIDSLLKVNGVQFFSLQKGPASEQAKSFGLIDWTQDLEDFAETAALIDNLDLVITVDTAVAHLAGAMGKPVWLLLPFIPDWRWMLDRADCPWYPGMRLFRQPKPRDWNTPIQQLAIELNALAKR